MKNEEGLGERKKVEDDKGIKTILSLTADSKEIVEETKHYLKEIWKRRKIENTREETRIIEHNYAK